MPAVKRVRDKGRSTAGVGRPRAGSDGAFREFKMVSFYELQTSGGLNLPVCPPMGERLDQRKLK